VWQVNNSVTFSGKPIGFEEFLNQIVEASGIIIDRRPNEKNRGRFSVPIYFKKLQYIQRRELIPNTIQLVIEGNIMFSRKVVREFLDEELKETEIPDDIFKGVLVKTFCKYVEDDYYEWLKDNFKSFFYYGKPDWQRIRQRIKKYEEQK